MTRTVSFRPEAELDLVNALSWYRNIHEGLGEDFLTRVEEALDRIRHFPEAYPIVEEDVRRVLTRRFPYGLFYFLDEESIVVIAVLNSSRDPGEWQSRLQAQ